MNARTQKRVVKLVVTLIFAAVIAAITAQNAIKTDAAPAVPGESSLQQVVAVVDGDTIKTVDQSGTENRVRIIGIDTPEIGRGGAADECYAQEARTALGSFVDGQTVTLVTDPSQGDVDKYGRLLRHVETDAGNIALRLLEQGAGTEYTYDDPYAGQADFRAAETQARTAGTGLWGVCP